MRGTKSHSELSEIVVTSSGTAKLGATEIRIPNINLQSEIGRGANGVVFLGTNRFLGRKLAIKLWLPMRKGDVRDKFRQGLREARKAASVSGKSIPSIYDAGC